jgi:RecA-family ATPase
MEERVLTRRFSTRRQSAVKWLWFPYIPIGKVTVIQGDPGTGKTTFALLLAAYISTGRPFPETSDEPITGESIYQSAEDDPADTIAPRLFALGADCSKISDISEPFNDIDKNCEVLEKAIREVSAKLAVIDPWQAYIGKGNDMNRASDVRRLMGGLAAVAARTECAIVAIAHMNKTQGAKNLYRGLGSIDFAASARSVLQITLAPEDRSIRVLSHIKSSLSREGDSLQFTIGDNSAVTFLGRYCGAAADMSEATTVAPEDTKKEQAKEIILQLLSDGSKPAKIVREACAVAGVGERTTDDAKRELGVKSVKEAANWFWVLPQL